MEHLLHLTPLQQLEAVKQTYIDFMNFEVKEVLKNNLDEFEDFQDFDEFEKQLFNFIDIDYHTQFINLMIEDNHAENVVKNTFLYQETLQNLDNDFDDKFYSSILTNYLYTFYRNNWADYI